MEFSPLNPKMHNHAHSDLKHNATDEASHHQHIISLERGTRNGALLQRMDSFGNEYNSDTKNGPLTGRWLSLVGFFVRWWKILELMQCKNHPPPNPPTPNHGSYDFTHTCEYQHSIEVIEVFSRREMVPGLWASMVPGVFKLISLQNFAIWMGL
ncbi:hypothetical protein VNO77_33919 [Canavalia gladiata]|uniref:Uncharacterized protein n=1 Tax=Canavalia gladiata TaxID=3824 RepID=A0AAN9KFL3_CANGL